MEQVENIIDYIIFKGHLITSTEKEIDYGLIYPDVTLDKLVILPLKRYLFNGFDNLVKNYFDSSDDAMSRCTNFFRAGDRYFGCKECAGTTNCVMCSVCFHNSIHASHTHWSVQAPADGGSCGCGDVEAWKSSPRCTLHQISQESKILLPKNLLQKFSSTIKHLCNFFEMIASNNSSLIDLEFKRMLANYKNMKKLEVIEFDPDPLSVSDDKMVLKSCDNPKMCLLVFQPEFPLNFDIESCFEACIYPEVDCIHYSIREISAYGYTCVKYRGSLEECQLIKENIENYSGGLSDRFFLPCRVISVPALYFWKLSSRMSELIRELCHKKTQLCDLLTLIVFRETSLAKVYIENERFMPEIFRYDMIYNILSLTLCSEYGKTYLTEIYLCNLDRIYKNFMFDYLDIPYCFINLTAQFVSHPSTAIYLVENGFLAKMIDCLTNTLNGLGIRKGEPVMKIFRKGGMIENKLKRVRYLFNAPRECLMNLFLIKTWSTKFRSEVSKAGQIMIRFSFSVDDIEPFNKINGKPDEELHYYYTRYIISDIHNLMINLSKCVYNCPNIVSDMLDKFIALTKNELVAGSFNFNPVQTIHSLISYSNIETKEFSIFNLSRRFFVDTLMRAVLDPASQSRKQFELVVKDQAMLTWLSLPSVVSISSYLNNFYTKWYDNSEALQIIYKLYRNPCHFHYFYLQDFTCVQILMSHMPPDQFLKYLLFSVYPIIREKSDNLQPLASLLTLTEFNNDVAFRELLILIYNCISEMHFIGVTSNYKYFFIERQLIHYLALGDQTHENILKEIRSRGGISTFSDDDVTTYLNEALERVSYSKTSMDGQNTLSLKSEYSRQINIYHFVYSAEQSTDLLQRLANQDDPEKYVFNPPEIVDLRAEFSGMSDFIISPDLLELVMHPMKRLWLNTGSEQYTPTQDLLISLMCLCFIIKSSKTSEIISAHRERIDLMFSKYNESNGKNITEVLANIQAKTKCPVLSSVIDYIINSSNGIFKAKNV